MDPLGRASSVGVGTLGQGRVVDRDQQRHRDGTDDVKQDETQHDSLGVNVRQEGRLKLPTHLESSLDGLARLLGFSSTACQPPLSDEAGLTHSMLMYSGPAIVNVAMITAFRNDRNWDEASVPTQGVSFQLRNPNLLVCQPSTSASQGTYSPIGFPPHIVIRV